MATDIEMLPAFVEQQYNNNNNNNLIDLPQSPSAQTSTTSSSNLTDKGVWFLCKAKQVESKACPPVVQMQVLEVLPDRKVANRYRITLSDGERFITCLVSAVLSPILRDQKVRAGSVVQVLDSFCETTSANEIVVVIRKLRPFIEPVINGADGQVQFEGNIQQAFTELVQKRALDSNQNSMSQDSKSNSLSNEQQQQQPSSKKQRVSSEEGDHNGRPYKSLKHSTKITVNDLSSYSHKSDWYLQVRCVSKSEFTTYLDNKSGEERRRFVAKFMDEHMDIVKKTFFDDQRDWQNQLKVGNVYCISRATIQKAWKPPNKVNSSDDVYELKGNKGTEIRQVIDDGLVPPHPCHFEKLSTFPLQLKNAGADFSSNNNNNSSGNAKRYNNNNNNSTINLSVDPLVVVCNIHTLIESTNGYNKQTFKRVIDVVDSSRVQCELTLFGEAAEAFEPARLAAILKQQQIDARGKSTDMDVNASSLDQDFSELEDEKYRTQDCDVRGYCIVLAVWQARLSTYNEISITVSDSSIYWVNPNVEEAAVLKDWYQDYGQLEFEPLTTARSGNQKPIDWQPLSIEEVRSVTRGPLDEPVYASILVSLKQVHCDDQNVPWYMGCPSCQKAITEEGFCRNEKCDHGANHTLVLDPRPKYRANVTFGDATGDLRTQCFGEPLDTLLGVTVEDAIQILNKHGSNGFEQLMKNAENRRFKIHVKCHSRVQRFNRPNNNNQNNNNSNNTDMVDESNNDQDQKDNVTLEQRVIPQFDCVKVFKLDSRAEIDVLKGSIPSQRTKLHDERSNRP